MRSFYLRWTIVAIVVLGSASLAWYALRGTSEGTTPTEQAEVADPSPRRSVIGSSVQGRQIEAYTYGRGKTHLAFVGGVHGGYEWNSILLAYALMDHLSGHPEIIPENMSVTVIPDANPDGVYKVIGTEGRFSIADVPIGISLDPGRFNAHGVDINRNFNCKWQATSTWKGKSISAGTAPFSEPEAQAIRDFVVAHKPEAVIFFHSKAGAVYASECKDGILPKTLEIMRVYSRASGYLAINAFDAYEITGDAEGWLASIGIPAITVELLTHETVEWERNLAGIKALLEYYRK